MGLYHKILAVMQDVGYLQKDGKVDAGYNRSYKAITEEKVTGAVGDAMRKHGLIIIPIEISLTREDLEVEGKNGVRLDRLTTVQNKYKIIDVETGEHEIIVSSGTGIDTQDKGIGKALTYAYKYLLLRTFAIPTGEDPDKTASDEDVKPVKPNVQEMSQADKEVAYQYAVTKLGEESAKKAWVDYKNNNKGIVPNDMDALQRYIDMVARGAQR